MAHYSHSKFKKFKHSFPTVCDVHDLPNTPKWIKITDLCPEVVLTWEKNCRKHVRLTRTFSVLDDPPTLYNKRKCAVAINIEIKLCAT